MNKLNENSTSVLIQTFIFNTKRIYYEKDNPNFFILFSFFSVYDDLL